MIGNAQSSCTANELIRVSAIKDFPCEASFGSTTYFNFVTISTVRNNIKTGTLVWQFRQDSINGNWTNVSNAWQGQGTDQITKMDFNTTDNGQYRCIFTDTVTGCKDYRRTTVTVFARPAISIGIDSTNCSGFFLGVHDNNNPTGINSTYCWEPDYGTSPPNCLSNDPYYLFSSVGCAMVVGTVEVIVTNEFGCENQTYISGLCNQDKLDVYASLSSVDTEFCAQSERIDIYRYSGTQPGGNWTFQWQKNGIGLSWAKTSFIKPTSSGTYTCLVSNGNGCTTITQPINVIVKPRPEVNLTPAGNVQLCTSDTLALNVVATAGSTFQWYKNNIAFLNPLPVCSVSTSGNYKVLVTGSNGCTRLSATTKTSIYRTSVQALGPVVFCNGDSVQLISNTGNTATWQWQLNNVNIPGAIAADYMAKVSGLYRVRGISTSGCRSYSNQIDVNVNCREIGNVQSNDLVVSPVPANEQLMIHLPDHSGNILIRVLNMNGQIILSKNLTENLNQNIELNIKELKSGLYLIHVITNSISIQKKFIKQE